MERKGTHYLALPERPEELWRSVKGSVRTDVRKAQKRGVNVREATKEKDVQACYRLYVETMSRLGGLAKPLRMVAALSRPPLGQLWIAEREGRAIAALLALVLADRITIWLNASNAEGRQLAANHLLYYSVLSWAIENGCRLADFGASPPENRGLIHFKASWGAVERPFGTFQKELRPLRSALWHFAEPRLRRLYRAVQRLR
ncbi:MAG: hypothetical protein KatS3mg115_1790 [Candidatus Poribacteria bacterium]|nr:MAG: hypothetical protein KatS3mg115_1790 [Candidatus Poribacteria bacterium]